MKRNRWRDRAALAALIPAMLFINIAAEATPPSPLGPHKVVATAQETACGSGQWIYLPCWDYGLQLTATEGEGGTALFTTGYDTSYQGSPTTTQINLTCVSIKESHHPRLTGGSGGHILRASGVAEDGTVYYFVAEDVGELNSDDWVDYLAMTPPGEGECGTGQRQWSYFPGAEVVITQ